MTQLELHANQAIRHSLTPIVIFESLVDRCRSSVLELWFVGVKVEFLNWFGDVILGSASHAVLSGRWDWDLWLSGCKGRLRRWLGGRGSLLWGRASWWWSSLEQRQSLKASYIWRDGFLLGWCESRDKKDKRNPSRYSSGNGTWKSGV